VPLLLPPPPPPPIHLHRRIPSRTLTLAGAGRRRKGSERRSGARRKRRRGARRKRRRRRRRRARRTSDDGVSLVLALALALLLDDFLIPEKDQCEKNVSLQKQKKDCTCGTTFRGHYLAPSAESRTRRRCPPSAQTFFEMRSEAGGRNPPTARRARDVSTRSCL